MFGHSKSIIVIPKGSTSYTNFCREMKHNDWFGDFLKTLTNEDSKSIKYLLSLLYKNYNKPFLNQLRQMNIL